MIIKIRKKTYKVSFTWKFPFVKITRLFITIKPTMGVSILNNTNFGIHPVYEKEYKRKTLLKFIILIFFISCGRPSIEYRTSNSFMGHREKIHYIKKTINNHTFYVFEILGSRSPSVEHDPDCDFCKSKMRNYYGN